MKTRLEFLLMPRLEFNNETGDYCIRMEHVWQTMYPYALQKINWNMGIEDCPMNVTLVLSIWRIHRKQNAFIE